MKNRSFETWLGSIVNPDEPFYLIAENDKELDRFIARIASIGYEKQIAVAIAGNIGNEKMEYFDSEELKKDHQAFTILDIRNPSEVADKKIFPNSVNIPLYELRERIDEIPNDKPIVVHCAAGFRSAAGSSIVHSKFDGIIKVYDLSEAVKTF
jgi:rhodanese-related sulfurtransferase